MSEKKSLLFLGIFLGVITSFTFPGFTYAALSASNSTVSVNPSSVSANGSSTATITVKLFDDASPPGPVNDHRIQLSLAGMTDSNLVINGGVKGAGSLTIQTGNNGSSANVATFTVSSSTIQTDNFTVRDVDQNVSLSSASVNFTSPSCGDSVPASPSLSSAISQGSNQIMLTWNTVSDPVSYYLIAYGTSSGKYIYGNPNVGKQNTYTVGSLSAGTTYYFVVKAVNGCSSGSYSNELSAIAGQNLTQTLVPTKTRNPTPISTPTQVPTASSSAENSNDQKSKESITNTPKQETPTEIPEPSQIIPTKKSAQTLIADITTTKNLGIIAGVLVLVFIFTAFFLYKKFKKLKPENLRLSEQEEVVSKADIKD